MFQNKLVRFMIKRISLLGILLSIVALFFEYRWPLLAGVLVGATISMVRFISNAWIFKSITDSGVEKSGIMKGVVFFMNQVLLLLILFIFYKVNLWLFVGFISGVLLAPLAIVINSLTEAIGLTHNNFYTD